MHELLRLAYACAKVVALVSTISMVFRLPASRRSSVPAPGHDRLYGQLTVTGHSTAPFEAVDPSKGISRPASAPDWYQRVRI